MNVKSVYVASVRRLAFSLVLVGACGWLVYKGTELIRFHGLHRDVAAALSAGLMETPTAAEIDALQARVAPWRDSMGLGYMARIDYRDIGGALLQTVPVAMQNAADVLERDPVNGQAWMDFAQASRKEPGFRSVALAAWGMSAVTAPREYPIMRQRLAFLLGVWQTAGDEQKQQFFFERELLYNIWMQEFRTDWKDMLSYLPEDRKRTVEAEIRNYSPQYK